MSLGELAPIVDGKNEGACYRPVNSVMHELERLDKLDRQARRDEVSDGAVNSSAIRTDVNGVLNEGVREPRLKVESRKQVLSEPTGRRANDQRAQIATHGRVTQTLVMVAWDNHFHKGREREPCRFQKLESRPEIEVLKRSVIRAIVDV